MIRGRQRHLYVADAKAFMDAVADAGNALPAHLIRHVFRRVVSLADAQQALAGGAAEVIVVNVRDQNSVQRRNVLWQHRTIKQNRHIEALQQGIDHDGRASAVDEYTGAPPASERPSFLSAQKPKA